MSCDSAAGSNCSACADQVRQRQARHLDQFRVGAAGAEDQQVPQMIDQRRDQRVDRQAGLDHRVGLRSAAFTSPPPIAAAQVEQQLALGQPEQLLDHVDGQRASRRR